MDAIITTIAKCVTYICKYMYSTSQKKRTVITVRVLVFTERTVLVVVVQDKHETLLILTAVATSSHTSTYAF